MRIAVVQCPAIADDAAAACEVIVQRVRWAEEEAIDLILFPEAFLLGHSYDPETIRSRAEASRSTLAQLCSRVAAFPTTLVVGAFERVRQDLFNSAFVIEKGRIAGRYAKVDPNEPG